MRGDKCHAGQICKRSACIQCKRFGDKALAGRVMRAVKGVIAVFFISDDRVPDMGEMSADLMRLARVQRHL